MPVKDELIGRHSDLYEALQAVRENLDAIRSDETLSETGRVKKAGKHVARLVKPHDRAVKALGQAASRRDELLKEVDMKVAGDVQAEHSIEREICDMLLSMGSAERHKFVSKAEMNGDMQALRAVANAPQYLSGIGDEQCRNVRRHLERTFAPEQLAEIGHRV